MMRLLPSVLRSWSGALLVRALMLCVAGPARPAMAMSPAMARAMAVPVAAPVDGGSAPPAVTGGPSRADAAPCPMTDHQCSSPHAVVDRDTPAAPPRAEAPQDGTPCGPVPGTGRPNAPPAGAPASVPKGTAPPDRAPDLPVGATYAGDAPSSAWRRARKPTRPRSSRPSERPGTTPPGTRSDPDTTR